MEVRGMADDLAARFQARWGFARGLTRDLLQFLDVDELAFSPSDRLGPLWKHFRHLGRVQENYLRSLETGRVGFGFDGTSYIAAGASKQMLRDYLDRVDARLKEQLRAVDVSRRIEWPDSAVDSHEHLMRMADHEVLHHGMFIVYMRLLGKGFPPSWAPWGL
jgi:uncharacterized damage-inducible protein DinB